MTQQEHKDPKIIDKLIRFCLENKLVVTLFIIVIIAWGIMVAPFDWRVGDLPRNPVPVDAIPDIGENQQIVFTQWGGRSPQDVEDQITYPLTVSLLGIPGVKTVRSYSMMGFSSIYVIFKEDVEFYWSRSRILERLNSLPSGTLPDGVQPALGPDATALGQVFWYTLEGRGQDNNPTGGWDLHELRTIQDFYVKYGLMAADGVSEVASVGGFVQEYQVDIDPDAMRVNNVSLEEVIAAVKMSNLDVGARTIEINKVEYVIRGLGFIKNLSDIEKAVIKVNDNVPIYVKNVAKVGLGPALRRGALDKEGAEVVGGVVVVRYGENPLATIKNVKEKIKEISPGLPRKTLPDGTVSQVTIVPFYDRTGLIYETLGTLESALTEEIIITIIVVILMLMYLKSSVLIAGLLPLAVLMCFIFMKIFGVDANIVALSGIAIAIGTMVDMGIVISENIVKHLSEADAAESKLEVIYRASSEVGSAILTAVTTTIVSFLPVFTMIAAEGKLFRPLAFTKTFALFSSLTVALVMIPPFAHLLFGRKWAFRPIRLHSIRPHRFSKSVEVLKSYFSKILNYVIVIIVTAILANHWLPLGAEMGSFINFLFVGLMIGLFLGFFALFQRFYPAILKWALNHKKLFLTFPLVIILLGMLIWLGFDSFFGWMPTPIKTFKPISVFAHKFPGLGKEFMPPLDEGSYLYMPTTMPHASIGEVLDVLQKQDMAFYAIPEVDLTVGKLGRAETSLDPAPVSMIETVINYKSEYLLDEHGHRKRFKFDVSKNDFFRDAEGNPLSANDGEPYVVKGKFIRDDKNQLIENKNGKPFRQWRSALESDLNDGREYWAGIQTPDDIWNEIVKAGEIPGTTSAPKLQPISTRLIMLQSGMRAPMGIKIKGPDLETIEKMGLQLEKLLKQVPSVKSEAVIADRIVGKPYLEIEIDRQKIARYGIKVEQVQKVIEVAIGGMTITKTVEGRERYGVRVRYMRELRDDIESLDEILVASPTGAQIPLEQLSTIEYRRGPQMIKSEDTFLLGYVLFDKRDGYAEVDVVEQANAYLEQKIESGELKIPAGVNYSFAGNYENQIRSQKKLMIVLPLALFLIFLILYFQFKSTITTALVFSGITVAWAGGFILIWLYGQSWFLDFTLFGIEFRNLFQINPINLSVAVWVGFLALFGIATDDGVVMATYLDQIFAKTNPKSKEEIRLATLEAGKRRIRPCLMTTATTVLALLPVLTSTGRGSDIMVPMAIPTFGGMLIEILTMFVVPVLYAAVKEIRIR